MASLQQHSHSGTLPLDSGVCDFIVCPLYLLNLEVIACHSCHPSMSNGIQIGCRHDIGEGIVVGFDQEGLVPQLLLELWPTWGLRILTWGNGI